MTSHLHGSPPGADAARPINLYAYRDAARERLPQMAYDYYAGGAHDEITLRANHDAYDRLRLRYRVLRDISTRDLATTVLGHRLDVPFYVAPTAFHRMAHPDGECGTARAAGTMGTAMMLSTLATTSIEDVTAAATGPVWFQLYVYRDREATRSLVQRAADAGCTALVLTVDAQIWGVRERDVRNGFQLPEGLSIENLTAADKGFFPESEGSGLAAYVRDLFDRTLSWSDLDWLCNIAEMPVLVKGVVRGDDAARAVEHGAAGVVVSNHGGRQLDTSLASIEALPEVVAAVDEQAAVFVDGGIRRGTDVLKALALGADAVGVGRPILWGLAVDGEAGARHVLELLREELDLAMALCGCATLEDVTPDLVAPTGLRW
jgi:4-hydroxymandelate oxidase